MRLQKVLERIPCKFVRELKRLYQALPLQFGQLALLRQSRSTGQLGKGLAKTLQALPPAHIGILRHSLKSNKKNFV